MHGVRIKTSVGEISTNETGKSLEFLDVLHMIDNYNKFKFFTTSFIKETATKRLFFNGILTTLYAFLNLLFSMNLLDYAD